MKDQDMGIVIMTETEEIGMTAQEGWYHLHCTCSVLCRQKAPLTFQYILEKALLWGKNRFSHPQQF